MAVIQREKDRGDTARFRRQERSVLVEKRRRGLRIALLNGLDQFSCLHTLPIVGRDGPGPLLESCEFYRQEKTAESAPFLITLLLMKANSLRRCEYCGHSMAAHADGVQCALCLCRAEARNFVQ